MITNEFKNYHPIVNLIYFITVTGFAMVFMHPLFLFISLVGAFSYACMLKGIRNMAKKFLFMAPFIIVMALMNPLFNHRGQTVLLYLPSSNPLTLESIIYGFSSSIMIISVILLFSCMNAVLTSDKFIYLSSKISPSLSLLISMALRFVPEFARQFHLVCDGQRQIGRDIKKGKLKDRIKTAVTITSIMITASLENALETSDSMKARGYGLKGRTAFSNFKIEKRDIYVLLLMLFLFFYVLRGALLGVLSFEYFPMLTDFHSTPYFVSLSVSYFLLCFIPVIIEIKEAIRWKALKSKI